jgi:hypothetical protein
MLGTNRAAADGRQLTAYSPRLSDSDSGPSAVSRKPIADVPGQVYEQFLGKVTRLTAGHQAKREEKPEVRKADGCWTPAGRPEAAWRSPLSNVVGGG